MTQRVTTIAIAIMVIFTGYIYGQNSDVRTFGVPVPVVQKSEKNLSPIEEELNTLLLSHPIEKNHSLFEKNSDFQLPTAFSRQLVTTDKVQYLTINEDTKRYLLANKPKTLSLTIPLASGEEIVVELYAKNPFSDDFKVVTDDGNYHRPTEQLHYRGVVKGYPGSLAGLSILKDEIMGVFSTKEHGQYNIAKLEDFDQVHAVYSDEIYPEDINVGCQDAIEIPREFAEEEEYNVGSRSHEDKCVKVYIETNYNLFLNKGSVTGVENYVNGLFNNVSIIFQNEEINTVISEIFVWTTDDPYDNSVNSALSQFRANRQSGFNGDLAHLFLLGGSGGGVAYLNTLCNPSFSFATSNINSGYNNFPNYSWTIMVVSHEMGHNLGSNHTQWCGWPGGAIDNCFDTEGSCPPGPSPSGGGTIMSYCHLTNSGINFLNGFGPLPGNRIRQRVGQVSCLGTDCANSCQNLEVTVTTVPTQCGLANGELYIDIQGGEAPYTIDIGQGFTSNQNFFNLESGEYQVLVYDANDCETTVSAIVESSVGLDIYAEATPTTCGEINGSIFANVYESNGSVEFNIGFGVSLDPFFPDLPAGLYTLTATDQSGCTFQENINIELSDPITASASTTSTSCGLDNGTAEITMAGGSGNFYFVNLDTGFGYNDNPVFENLFAGTHTAYVQDDIGCQMIFDFEILDSAPIEVEVNVTDATCGEANGSVGFDISGGSGNNIFYISISGIDEVLTGDTLSDLAPGTYDFTITDDLDCEESGTFTVEDSDAIGLNAEVTGTTCGLENGSVVATTSMTTGNLIYELNGVEQTSPIFEGLGTGLYTLTATSDNGCVESLEVEIQATDSLDAELSITNAYCGELGQIEVVVPNSSGYLYNIGQGNQESPIFTNIAAGVYTIQVSDSNGCLGVVMAEVIGTTPVVLDVDTENTSCGLDNGGFALTVTGGSGDYEYSFSDPNIQSSSAQNLASGMYQVTVSDSDGCGATASFTLDSSEEISAVASSINTSCGLNNGTINIDVITGQAPFTFDFGNGPETGVNSASNLAAGLYQVTITDGSQCTGILEVTIAASSPIEAQVSLQGATCEAANGSLMVNNVTGGNGPYVFTLGQTTSEQGVFTNLSSGSYILSISDDQECTFTENITIGNSGVLPQSDFSVARNGLDVVLTNNSIGTNNTYHWSFGDGTSSDEFQPTALYAASGNYEICLITTNACGVDTLCKSITVFQISECRQQDSLILVDLYMATDGANWTQPWDLSSPIDTWYGLEFYEEGCLGEILLSNNNLNGFIPASIGNLSRLEILALDNNNLYQELPQELSFLSFLIRMDLSFNKLEGSIPSSLGDLANLQTLHFEANLLEGAIPTTFQKLKQLEYLNLSMNKLNGGIPNSLMELNNLEYLDLSQNVLSGAVPDQIGMMSRLEYLYIHQNEFTGQFPVEVTQLDSLRALWIHSNRFNAFPDIQSMNQWNDEAGMGIRLENNLLTFKDVLYNMPLFDNLENASYAPQAKVFRDTTVTIPIGGTLSLDIEVDGEVPDVIYEWYREEDRIYDFSSPMFQISSIEPQMSGIYIGKLKHPLVPDLVLETYPVRIEVELSNATSLWATDLIQISMHPNPVAAGAQFRLDCMSQMNERITYSIMDISGRSVCASGHLNLVKGSNIYPISAPLIPGMYLIRLQSQIHEGVKNIKLVVY